MGTNDPRGILIASSTFTFNRLMQNFYLFLQHVISTFTLVNDLKISSTTAGLAAKTHTPYRLKIAFVDLREQTD